MKLDMKSLLLGAALAAAFALGSLAATSPPSRNNEAGTYVPYPSQTIPIAVLDTRTGEIYTVSESIHGVTNPVEGTIKSLGEPRELTDE